jgi:L-ribulose-5-phosphate 3-epimerase
MKIGFLHNSLAADLPQAFKLAAKAGADGLEVQYSSDEDVAALRDHGHVKEIKGLARASGVSVSSLCLGFLCRQPSLIDSPREVEAARGLIARAAEVASELRAGVIVLPFFGNSAIELEDELEHAIGVLEDLVETAEEAKVALGIESTLNFNQHRFLLNHFAHTSAVRAYYDTGNAWARKLDLPTGIRNLGKGAIGGIHFKDVRLREGTPPDYSVRLGEGDVDFHAVVQALKAIEYDSWVILETPAGANVLATAKADLAFARGVVGVQTIGSR